MAESVVCGAASQVLILLFLGASTLPGIGAHRADIFILNGFNPGDDPRGFDLLESKCKSKDIRAI